jgi:hypothetical protein
VAAVEARGALPSVADHLSRDVSSAVKSPAAVAAYLDMLEALRVDVPALGIAGEFCWHDALWRELDEHTWARFTHTVGSLHAVTLPDGRWLHMFASRWPAGLDVDAYMDAHVASLERFAAEMPVELLATPRCCPIPLRGARSRSCGPRRARRAPSPRSPRAASRSRSATGTARTSAFVRRAVDAGGAGCRSAPTATPPSRWRRRAGRSPRARAARATRP